MSMFNVCGQVCDVEANDFLSPDYLSYSKSIYPIKPTACCQAEPKGPAVLLTSVSYRPTIPM